MQQLRLGVDIACRTPHQASLADETGRFLWSGRRFRTDVGELEALWASLPADAGITVVIEPTRNAWVPLASWFRRRGATVVMVPSEQSADLRDYYSKHTKSDRLDSKLLATLPLLHPEGLYPLEHLGPGEPLRRATRLRSSLVKRRSKVIGRIDALLEVLGPQWYLAFDGKLDPRPALSPADDRGGQAPQLRRLHDRDDASDADRLVLALGPAIRHPRSRRHGAHGRRGAQDRLRSLHG